MAPVLDLELEETAELELDGGGVVFDPGAAPVDVATGGTLAVWIGVPVDSGLSPAACACAGSNPNVQFK